MFLILAIKRECNTALGYLILLYRYSDISVLQEESQILSFEGYGMRGRCNGPFYLDIVADSYVPHGFKI